MSVTFNLFSFITRRHTITDGHGQRDGRSVTCYALWSWLSVTDILPSAAGLNFSTNRNIVWTTRYVVLLQLEIELQLLDECNDAQLYRRAFDGVCISTTRRCSSPNITYPRGIQTTAGIAPSIIIIIIPLLCQNGSTVIHIIVCHL